MSDISNLTFILFIMSISLYQLIAGILMGSMIVKPIGSTKEVSKPLRLCFIILCELWIISIPIGTLITYVESKFIKD